MYYRGILNANALKNLAKNAHIPDMRLMVGCAERLASLPVLVYKDFTNVMPKPLVQPLSQMKNEDVASKLDGVTYTVDDFVFNTFFLGDAIDGG